MAWLRGCRQTASDLHALCTCYRESLQTDTGICWATYECVRACFQDEAVLPSAADRTTVTRPCVEHLYKYGVTICRPKYRLCVVSPRRSEYSVIALLHAVRPVTPAKCGFLCCTLGSAFSQAMTRSLACDTGTWYVSSRVRSSLFVTVMAAPQSLHWQRWMLHRLQAPYSDSYSQ